MFRSLNNSNYRAIQLHSNTHTNSHYLEMDNDQNARYFPVDVQLRYHWGAGQEIMTIINKRSKSPETSELVTRRIELAKPGAMRPHWNKNLGREIYVPRRPEENERREIKRIDFRLKRIGNLTSAAVIPEISAMKYRKERDKTNKHTKTPNQPPPTIPKKQQLPTNPEPTPQYRYRNTATAQSRR